MTDIDTTNASTNVAATLGEQPPADDAPQQSIPYSRFKQMLDRAKAAETELTALKASPPPASNTPPPTGDNPPPSAPDVSPNSDQDYTALQSKYDQVAAELASMKLSRTRDRAAVANGIPLDLAANIVGDTEEAIQAEAARLKAYIGQRPKAPNIDGNTPDMGGHVFTKAEISDPAFFASHHDEIMFAVGAGRVRWE